MSNPRTSDPRRDPGSSDLDEAQPTAHRSRIADLEVQLAEARGAMAEQRREFDEDATSFGQALARLSHSERTLGQTKAKLLDAEDRERKAEARIAALSADLNRVESLMREQRVVLEQAARDERERVLRDAGEELSAKLELHNAEIGRLRPALDAALERELEQARLLETLRAESEAKSQALELANERASRALAQENSLREMAESLSHDSAAGAAECARLAESCNAAEEREHTALACALEAHSEREAVVAELAELGRREARVTIRSNALELERNQALLDLASLQTAHTEREAQLAAAEAELAGAAKERARFIGIFGALEMLGRQIAEVGFRARAEAETRSGTEHGEPDSEPQCITLKPGPPPKHAPRSLRVSTAPEILIDGVRLER